MIDGTTIEAITKLAHTSLMPQLHERDDIAQLGVAYNGTIEWKDLPPKLEVYRAADLASFASYVLANKTDASAVYVDFDRVEFREMPSRQTKSAIFEPEPSSEYTQAMGLARALDQKEIIRIIRRDLTHCFSDLTFLNSLRKIDFSRKSNGVRTVEHGRESLGKSVEESVQAADGSPLAEEITLLLRAFKNSDIPFKGSMRFVIDVDYDSHKVRMEPTGISCEEYFNNLRSFLEARVVEVIEDAVPVYLGSASNPR